MKRFLVTAAALVAFLLAPLTVELRAAVITNLVNYWSMSGAASAQEDDQHGTLDLSDNGGSGSAAGCVGNGRTFNGSSQWLTSATGVTVPLDGTAGPWTFQVWVKSASTAQTNAYLAQASDSGGTDQSAVIYEFVDDTVEFFSANYTGTDPRTSSGLTVADTNCHQIVYRKNASGASVWDKFVDGSKTQISASIDFTLPSTVDRFIVGGAVGGASLYNGTLDEIGWWDTNLSDAEITWLYNGGAGRSYTDIQNEGAAPSCNPVVRFLLFGVGGC